MAGAPRAPRVYGADVDGVHEWIVAAPNRRAALNVFGVHQDLFAQGRAWAETDEAKIEAARAEPSVALRRPKGSTIAFEATGSKGVDSWGAALKAAPKPGPAKKGKRADKAPAPQARPGKTPAMAAPEPKAKPTGPSAADRMALRKAQAVLRAFEREAVKELAALDAERQDLDLRERRLIREQGTRRDALQRAVAKARAVVENAR